jgi:hypothetical protein
MYRVRLQREPVVDLRCEALRVASGFAGRDAERRSDSRSDENDVPVHFDPF